MTGRSARSDRKCRFFRPDELPSLSNIYLSLLSRANGRRRPSSASTCPPLPAHPYSIAGILFNPTSRIWLLWWKQRLDAGQLRLLFTHFTHSFSFFAFSFGANLRFLPKRINGHKENNTGRRFFFQFFFEFPFRVHVEIW